jgi:DNA-binding protein H-NS
MAKDVDKMSYKELQELILKAKRAMTNLQERERSALRKKMEEMAANAGLKLSEVVGGRGGKGRTVAIKYANPEDATQTWTGRGRKPKWLSAKLAAGGRIEKFLIK